MLMLAYAFLQRGRASLFLHVYILRSYPPYVISIARVVTSAFIVFQIIDILKFLELAVRFSINDWSNSLRLLRPSFFSSLFGREFKMTGELLARWRDRWWTTRRKTFTNKKIGAAWKNTYEFQRARYFILYTVIYALIIQSRFSHFEIGYALFGNSRRVETWWNIWQITSLVYFEYRIPFANCNTRKIVWFRRETTCKRDREIKRWRFQRLLQINTITHFEK